MIAAQRTPAWQPTLGAWPEAAGTRFRVWAPAATRLEVVLAGNHNTTVYELDKAADGTFSALVPRASVGQRYRYRVDGQGPYPDPVSRFQPEGVHGPSEIVDARRFQWSDREWRGHLEEPLVLYELHVGTFTPAGTFAGARERLADLRDLGITAIELMPVADFAGDRNWGYDGVALFAPARCYGRPDDLRGLVNHAHALGLAVYLDVVYNHLGPDGAYLGAFSQFYVSNRHRTPWGAAVNLDGEHSDMVRRFFIENALHWVHEYHVDGLRLDATHALIDESPRHFLAELSAAVHGVPDRRVRLIAEDHRNLRQMLSSEAESGWDLDGVWADDFHHQMRRIVAGDCEGYFSDFTESTRDLATIIQRGWLYCGQYPSYLQEHCGTDPTGVPPHKLVFCLQNHDQIGNRATGDRLHHAIHPALYRAATVLLLCLPETPLLFQGQEWAASTPFLYFSDHHPDLGRQITEGRRNEFRNFSAFSDPDARQRIPDPQSASTFAASKLIWSERARPPHRATLDLYRALLQLRRGEPALARTASTAVAVAASDTALALLRVPSSEAGPKPRALLAIVQLRGQGRVALRDSAMAPHLHRVAAGGWESILSTEDRRFCTTAMPVLVDAAHPAPSLQFRRPGAVLLRAAAQHASTSS